MTKKSTVFPILVYMTVNQEFKLIESEDDLPYMGTMKILAINATERDLSLCKTIDSGDHAR